MTVDLSGKVAIVTTAGEGEGITAAEGLLLPWLLSASLR